MIEADKHRERERERERRNFVRKCRKKDRRDRESMSTHRERESMSTRGRVRVPSSACI